MLDLPFSRTAWIASGWDTIEEFLQCGFRIKVQMMSRPTA